MPVLVEICLEGVTRNADTTATRGCPCDHILQVLLYLAETPQLAPFPCSFADEASLGQRKPYSKQSYWQGHTGKVVSEANRCMCIIVYVSSKHKTKYTVILQLRKMYTMVYCISADSMIAWYHVILHPHISNCLG